MFTITDTLIISNDNNQNHPQWNMPKLKGLVFFLNGFKEPTTNINNRYLHFQHFFIILTRHQMGGWNLFDFFCN